MCDSATALYLQVVYWKYKNYNLQIKSDTKQ